MANTADDTRPPDNNKRPLWLIRQWRFFVRNCPTRGRLYMVNGLLVGHPTFLNGKFYSLILPSPVEASQLQCGQTIACSSGHIFELGEKRNKNFEPLQSFYLEKCTGEELRKPTWQFGQSKGRAAASICPQRNAGRRRSGSSRRKGVGKAFGTARTGKHDFHSEFCPRSCFNSLQKKQERTDKPVHQVYNQNYGATAGRSAASTAPTSERSNSGTGAAPTSVLSDSGTGAVDEVMPPPGEAPTSRLSSSGTEAAVPPATGSSASGTELSAAFARLELQLHLM